MRYDDPTGRKMGMGLYGRGAATARAGTSAPATTTAADLFGRRYGNSTPQRERFAPSPAPGQGGGGGGGRMQASPGFTQLTPETAPVINASAPGILTGNPAIGFSGEEWGFGAAKAPGVSATPWQEDDRGFKQQFGQGRPDAWASWDQKRRQQWKDNHYQGGAAAPPTAPAGGSMQDLIGAAAGGLLGGAGPTGGAPGGAGAAGPTGGWEKVSTMFDGGPSLYRDGAGQEWIVGPPGPDGQPTYVEQNRTTMYANGGAPGGATGPGKMANATAPSGSPSEGFTGANGNFRSWDDVDWNTVINQDPKAAGDLVQQYIQFSDDPTKGFWNALDINKPKGMRLPDFDAYTGQPVNIPWDTNQGAIFDVKGQFGSQLPDEGVRWLAAKMLDWQKTIRDLTQQGANTTSSEKLADAVRKSNAATAMLQRYGVTFNALGDGVGGGGEGGGEGGSGGGNVYDDPGNHPPGVSDERSVANLGDTDLATVLPGYQAAAGEIKRALQGIGVDLSKMEPSAILEFLTSKFLLEDSMQNKQKGVNILQGQWENTLAENNPQRQASEELMAQIMANPDPVDWQGVRNRYVSDEQKGLENAIQAVSGSAARRGLSAGDLSGLTGEMFKDHGSTVARGLGELTTQEQSQLRDRQLQALIAGTDMDRHYSGAEQMMAQILANAVMGTPQAAANPYSGMANTAANMKSIQLGMDAADDAKDSAGSQLLGNAAGALFGAGGNIFGSKYGSKWLFGG